MTDRYFTNPFKDPLEFGLLLFGTLLRLGTEGFIGLFLELRCSSSGISGLMAVGKALQVVKHWLGDGVTHLADGNRIGRGLSDRFVIVGSAVLCVGILGIGTSMIIAIWLFILKASIILIFFF